MIVVVFLPLKWGSNSKFKIVLFTLCFYFGIFYQFVVFFRFFFTVKELINNLLQYSKQHLIVDITMIPDSLDVCIRTYSVWIIDENPKSVNKA